MIEQGHAVQRGQRDRLVYLVVYHIEKPLAKKKTSSYAKNVI